MDAADDMSDTISETSLLSKRSMHSMRQAGTPQRGFGMGAPPSIGRRPGSVRGSARGGDEAAMSDVSRDVGGLLDGWDEKFVYKVSPPPRPGFHISPLNDVFDFHPGAWRGVAYLLCVGNCFSVKADIFVCPGTRYRVHVYGGALRCFFPAQALASALMSLVYWVDDLCAIAFCFF